MKIQPRYYLGTSNGLSRNTSKESAVSIPQNVNQAKSLVELECRVPASHTNQLSESSQIVMSCALQLTDMDLFDEWTHAHKLRSDGASNTVGWFQLLRICGNAAESRQNGYSSSCLWFATHRGRSLRRRSTPAPAPVITELNRSP
ncbi:hypothetical protein FOIG_05833 [Fusarium odoratissimum NRRL 54006]|uniref:Uncharacterized protein n=1 Tax=Fusarium odoratissimum (strain NRRL 54006) TaxID=1089451 RepID=X0JNT0_FUSO5|nr:uncharacterized protein FOIG_05833 [Fusarium odoratissimum NRRL 54006]EXM02848.1 hypothetical protein FOIG_05833 [Fusarium odoratissimum NRRL 54006]